MADQIEIVIPRPSVPEGSHFTATAYFRDRATSAASTPTTAKYRVDCATTGAAVLDWTALTAASSISITLSRTVNAMQSQGNRYETRELTVMADDGLSTQVRQTVRYRVENIQGVTV